MRISERIFSGVNRVAMSDRKTKHIYSLVAFPLFFGHIAIFIVGSILLDTILDLPKLLASPSNRIVSIFLMGAGVFLFVWSIVHFLKQKGTPIPFNPPQKLIISGPYLYSRNPMMSGWFLLVFGIGFFLNSIAVVGIGVPLFILFHLWEIKKVEEPELESRFGREYMAYKKSVGMFFPKIRRGD